MNEQEFAKFFPSGFTLETPRALLRELAPEDLEQLLLLSGDPATFNWFSKDLSQPGALQRWIDEALQQKADGLRMPFTIFDKDAQQICGCTAYGSFSFPDFRVEVGWTWLGPAYMGTGVNKHAKFALFSYAFERMRMERVEAKTDVLNERSRAALIKVGMKPEGVLRSHMQVHGTRRRDSMYFSIIRNEWGERKEHFFTELM